MVARFRTGWPHQTAALSGVFTAVSDAAAIADELYLSVYTRRPTDDERGEIIIISLIAARNAYPPCRSSPGRSWHQPSFDSTISHLCGGGQARRPSAPPAWHRRRLTMRCTYACGKADHIISRRTFLGQPQRGSASHPVSRP